LAKKVSYEESTGSPVRGLFIIMLQFDHRNQPDRVLESSALQRVISETE